MKKLFAILLALILALSLAACGGADKPSGGIADIEDGGSQGSQGSETPDLNDDSAGQSGVEIKDDRVVSTTDDGFGNISVTEYIYKDGEISEITLTMQCADAATAKDLYDSYATGSMKEYGDQLYSEIKPDGKNVIFIFNDEYISSFSGISMEELADVLETGGSSSGEQAPSLSESPADGETAYNYAWSDLNLPDGFPQLDSGVTNYNEVDGGYMLTWNVMELSKLEEMITKLETWSGLTLEVSIEMETAKGWSAESDTLAITVNYFADTVDSQVMITIQTF